MPRVNHVLKPLSRKDYFSDLLNPIENVWAYLRANRLAISVFETYDDIVARCCVAWNFFANDITTVQSITTREYARTVRD